MIHQGTGEQGLRVDGSDPDPDLLLAKDPSAQLPDIPPLSTALAAPQERIVWRAAAALQARVSREGFLFVTTIEQIAGEWLAVGLATPEDESDRSLGERAQQVLDSHAHQILAERVTLMEAMAVAEMWLVTARVPTELCDCDDIGGGEEEQAASSKQQAPDPDPEPRAPSPEPSSGTEDWVNIDRDGPLDRERPS